MLDFKIYDQAFSEILHPIIHAQNFIQDRQEWCICKRWSNLHPNEVVRHYFYALAGSGFLKDAAFMKISIPVDPDGPW